MHPLVRIAVLLLFIIGATLPSTITAKEILTIVRDSGRTGFIDNSLVATAVAVEKGADYLELPVQMTADDQLVVHRNPALDATTNAADLFPMRSRKDGKFYIVDFTLSELLQVRRIQATEGGKPPLQMPIPSLKESLGLINRLGENQEKQVGVVIELVQPSFYREQGKNIGMATVQTLTSSGYTGDDRVYIESSDPDELQKTAYFCDSQRIRRFPLIQLAGGEVQAQEETGPGFSVHDNSWLFTNTGLRMMASYATAVALPAATLEGETHMTMDISRLLKTLRLYNIRIFAITHGGEMVQLPMEPTLDPIAVQGTAADNTIDGIYISSFRKMAPEPAEDTEPLIIPVKPLEEAESSTLPPFFSNLGLKQPNHNAQVTQETKQDQLPETEESKQPAENSEPSWD